MLHPSYTELMKVVNSEAAQGEQPVVQSRYSIVLATAKRARQIIGGQEELVKTRSRGVKPLSTAVDELYQGKIKILTEEEAAEMMAAAQMAEESKRFVLEDEILAQQSEEAEAELALDEETDEKPEEIADEETETVEEAVEA